MTTDPTLDPARAFEESPFDFNGYLARRFGVSREAATSDLGHWLARYERVASRSGSTPGIRPCRSGVFPAPENAERSPLARTGAA